VIDAATEPTVHVVDDDPQVRESLSLLIQSAGLAPVVYASAEEFLATCRTTLNAPVCLVLDVRMPGLSGLGLQRELTARGIEIPIIMISGYADVPTAVQAMGAGAMDFLEKPFSRQTLLQRILEALDRSAQQRFEQTRRAEIFARVATLSSREREVMGLLVAGKNAKHIAAQFGIGEKTVLKHRSRVFDKLKVDNIAELVRIVLSLGSSWPQLAGIAGST
jgi:two-component system response regulator FixJ